MLKPFDSPQYRKRTLVCSTGDECCICGKSTSGLAGAIHVPVNHERNEFVTDDEAKQLGDKVSYFPVGPECAKKWSKEIVATSVGLRLARGVVVAYDEQTVRR